MKILFIALYFTPESYSSRHVTPDLAKQLIDLGHQVTIVCPNPVRGLSPDAAANYLSKPIESIEDGIRIFRVPCGGKMGSTLLQRFLRILRFRNHVIAHLKNNAPYDWIIVPSNPPLAIPLAVIQTCQKLHIKTVYTVNDIWPEIASSHKTIFSLLLKKYSRKCLSKATAIVTLSEDMKSSLIKKGAEPSKIHVIRIWPSDNSTIPPERLNIFDKSHFSVAYIGNIGSFQGIDFILEAVEKIDPSICHFYFVGGGRRAKELQKKIADGQMKNVTYVPRVSEETARILYCEADLNLISINPGAIFFACPSKTSMCLSSDSECLVLADPSEYTKFLQEQHGFYVDSSYDPSHIAKTIEEIAKTKTRRRVAGPDPFTKDSNLMKWTQLLENAK